MRRNRIDFRLLKMEEPFFEYVESNNVEYSEALRHFIRIGVREDAGFSLKEQAELRGRIVDMAKVHRGISNNLNQIAREANRRGDILENTLAGTLNETLESQNEITGLLNALLKKI